MKLNTLLYIGIVSIIVGLIFTISTQSSNIRNLKKELAISTANEKALFEDNSSLQNKKRTLQLTVDQLNHLNDSIIMKMNETRRELKVKDKYIQSLEYQLSEASKTDTIVFRDTLFRESTFQLDTTMMDKWYSLNLQLKYPSTIIASPKFISERYVIQSFRKEPIKIAKKCWIWRVFQRKHIVLETEVVEKSPYIINKKEKYIKIID